MSDRKKIICFPCMLAAALLFSACSAIETTPVPLPPPVKLTPIVGPPTATRAHPTPVPVSPSPTSTSTAAQFDELTDMGPFRYVDTVADLMTDAYGRVRLHAPEDGSVWMLTILGNDEKSVARWEADDGQIIFLRDEGTQVTIDQAGRAWVVKPEAVEIEVWERGDWAVQGIDRGRGDDPPIYDMWIVPGYLEAVSNTQGKVWLPIKSEVRVFDGSRWSIYRRDDMGFSEPEREEIVIDSTIAVLGEDAQIWVGDCYISPLGPYGGGGLRWFDGNSWVGSDAPIGETCVSVLTVDPGGDLWIGVEDAIWLYQPDSKNWTVHQLPGASQFGFNYNQPDDMLIDQDGDVWAIVELCGGAHCYAASYLYRIHQGVGSVVEESSPWDGMPQRLLSGADGRNWLLWGGLFYQIVGGDLVPIIPLEVRGITTDPTGRVWALVGQYEQAALWVLDIAH